MTLEPLPSWPQASYLDRCAQSCRVLVYTTTRVELQVCLPSEMTRGIASFIVCRSHVYRLELSFRLQKMRASANHDPALSSPKSFFRSCFSEVNALTTRQLNFITRNSKETVDGIVGELTSGKRLLKHLFDVSLGQVDCDLAVGSIIDITGLTGHPLALSPSTLHPKPETLIPQTRALSPQP